MLPYGSLEFARGSCMDWGDTGIYGNGKHAYSTVVHIIHFTAETYLLELSMNPDLGLALYHSVANIVPFQ